MKYDFDRICDRSNTNCVKWDTVKAIFGRDDVIPMWVADMDFPVAQPIVEALKITREDVAESLEGLPPVKMHCSNLAADALHAAIEDYLKKGGRGEWLNGKKEAPKKKPKTRKGARRQRAA
jgi:bifunctional pyridoxal-dependent enzyme with beta-cystathionase and maltose regulon repressor activities